MNPGRQVFPTLWLARDLCPDVVALAALCALVWLARVIRAGVAAPRQTPRVSRARAMWLAAISAPVVLLSWLVIAATIEANRRWGFAVRYLLMAMPFLYLLVAHSLFVALGLRRLALALLTALIAINLLNQYGAFYPPLTSERLIWNQSFEKSAERSHEYLRLHAANIQLARRLESSPADAVLIASFPYPHYLGLPRLGYVSRPLRGYCFDIGRGVPSFKNMAQWNEPAGVDPIFVGDRYGRFAIPQAEPGDEILFDDQQIPPLLAYQKRWRQTPRQSVAQVKDWVLTRQWPGDWLARQLMVRADVLAVLGMADRAVEELRAALPLPVAPANSMVELRLASLQRAQGDSAAAAATLRDLLLRAPDLLTAHEMLTEIEFTQGEHDAALARLTGLAARHPDSKPARIVLVQTLLRMGRALEARPWLEQLTRLDPSDGAVWLQLGVICAASGDAAPARVALERALALPLDEANRRLAREHLAGLPQR